MGNDNKSGSSQDQPGSDGIGDTPYIIDVANQDNYPFINPWASLHKFSIGDWVQTTASLNVREGSGLNYTILGTMPLGTVGQIMGGPVEADGYVWWDVDYDMAIRGWSVEDGLELATAESRKMQIARLITQEAIEGVPVTVVGQYYSILTLRAHIDPITLGITPDILTKVYVEVEENYPIWDPETARKTGIIDYVRQIAAEPEDVRDSKEALTMLGDIYLMLSSSDLAIAATNLGVSGVKLVRDMKTISDVLRNVETIEDFAKITVPRSLAGFFTKTLELVMRKLIYDPMKELGSDLRSELSQAIRDYGSVLELLENGEITDYSVAASFLSSYLSAKAHEDQARYLLEKILSHYLVIVDELYKPVAALATWGLSNFLFLVKEAMLSLEWTINLLQRQIISTYENSATLYYKLLASAEYTLELAGTPSELIHEFNIKYADCVAEGYRLAAEAVEEVLTITIPFIGRISLLSPAELRVYDSNGQITGVVDGEEKNEIPCTAYYENTIVFFSDDVYRFEVAGIEEGLYGLETEGIFIEDNESVTFTAMGIPITPKANHQYNVDWDALSMSVKGVTVQIDSDGDRAYEHTFFSDATLTGDEFTIAMGGPTVESCNSTGTVKDSFDLSDSVYVKGEGYQPSATYDLYVVNATTWSDGKPIPQRLEGTATTITSDVSGNITVTLVWSSPIAFGNYDIVVDVNRDGYYNSSIDALDQSNVQIKAGFQTVPEFPSVILAIFMAVAILTAALTKKNRTKRFG